MSDIQQLKPDYERGLLSTCEYLLSYHAMNYALSTHSNCLSRTFLEYLIEEVDDKMSVTNFIICSMAKGLDRDTYYILLDYAELVAESMEYEDFKQCYKTIITKYPLTSERYIDDMKVLKKNLKNIMKKGYCEFSRMTELKKGMPFFST